jgi:hypothetical protein
VCIVKEKFVVNDIDLGSYATESKPSSYFVLTVSERNHTLPEPHDSLVIGGANTNEILRRGRSKQGKPYSWSRLSEGLCRAAPSTKTAPPPAISEASP